MAALIHSLPHLLTPERIDHFRVMLEGSLKCPVSRDAQGNAQFLSHPCTLSPCGHTVNEVVAKQRHGLYFPHHQYYCIKTDSQDPSIGKRLGIPVLTPCAVCDTHVETWTEDSQLTSIGETFQKTLRDRASKAPIEKPTESEIKETARAFLKNLVCPVTHELLTEACALSPCGHSINEGAAIALYGRPTTVHPKVYTYKVLTPPEDPYREIPIVAPIPLQKPTAEAALLPLERCKPHTRPKHCPYPDCHEPVLTWTENKKLRTIAGIFEQTLDPAAAKLPPIRRNQLTYFLPTSNAMARFLPHYDPRDSQSREAGAHDENTNRYLWESIHPEKTLLLRIELQTLADIHYLRLQFRCPDLKTYLLAQGFEIHPMGKPRTKGPDIGTYDVYEVSAATQEQFKLLLDAIEHYSVFLPPQDLGPNLRKIVGQNPQTLAICRTMAREGKPDQFKPFSHLNHIVHRSVMPASVF